MEKLFHLMCEWWRLFVYSFLFFHLRMRNEDGADMWLQGDFCFCFVFFLMCIWWQKSQRNAHVMMFELAIAIISIKCFLTFFHSLKYTSKMWFYMTNLWETPSQKRIRIRQISDWSKMKYQLCAWTHTYAQPQEKKEKNNAEQTRDKFKLLQFKPNRSTETDPKMNFRHVSCHVNHAIHYEVDCKWILA